MPDILNATFLDAVNQVVDRRLLHGPVSVSVALVCSIVLSGCSNSADIDTINDSAPAVSVAAPDQEPLTLIPDDLLQLEDEPGLLAEIPDVVASQTLADTGLQVAYTDPVQIEAVPALIIEAQWVFMQSCLEQLAPAPLVVVQAGPVTPFTLQDDVIHSIEGIPIASASTSGAAVIFQVQDIDFDGSLGMPAFNLRSIMGRFIWLNANLAERDYPFSCAQQQP